MDEQLARRLLEYLAKNGALPAYIVMKALGIPWKRMDEVQQALEDLVLTGWLQKGLWNPVWSDEEDKWILLHNGEGDVVYWPAEGVGA